MTPRKTATEIKNAIIVQIETSLNTTVPLFTKAFIRVLAKALGGVFVLLYQYCGFIQLQMFVKYASNKPVTIGGITMTPLQVWGELVGVQYRNGQQAEHTITITVLSQVGSLPSGTRVVNQSNGVIFTTVGDVALDAATVTATVRAAEAGEKGNVDVGTELQFQSAPSTVEKAVEVATNVTVGTDPEETEIYRRRVREWFAARPQGGAYADYREWAESVEGVKRAYPYSGWKMEDHPVDGPTQGSGEVFVFVESDADDDGVPAYLNEYGRPTGLDSGLLVDVFNAIETNDSGLASRREINAFVRVYPIHARTWNWTTGGRTLVNIEIAGLEMIEDEDATKTLIEDAVREYIEDREPYIPGLDIAPRRDILNRMSIGAVAAQIAASKGGVILGLTMNIEGNDEEIWYLQEGERPILNELTWG